MNRYNNAMTDSPDEKIFPYAENGINVYNEKSLHAALKQWYALPGDQLEVRVDGFIIDLVRGEQLVEIQTGSFNPLKRKLATLAQSHPVRLVFPIAAEKWILRQPQTGDAAPQRRKSPRHGTLEYVFAQLIYIPALLSHENFSLEVLLIREEEVRRHEEKKAWRRKGWVTQERRLLDVMERRVFETPAQLAALLPASLREAFTIRDICNATGQPDWLARRMIYCFRAMNIVDKVGKKGNAILYSRLAP